MAEGRAQAEAAPDIDVSSDSGETYSGDVGGGRGSGDSEYREKGIRNFHAVTSA